MAYPSSTFFLFALALVATTIPLAHCALINGISVAQINVAGRLFCSATGNAIGTSTAGLGGVSVFLTCNGRTSNLAQAVTDPTGAFTIVFSSLDSIVFDASSCFVTVNLPVASCTLLPPTGNIQAVLSLVGIVQTTLGQVASLVVGPFSLVSI